MKTAGKRRLVVWGGVGVVAIGALVVALVPRPVPVDTAAVDRGQLAVTLDHEGRTRVHERYVVSAPLPGRVLRIELRPGDPVRGGETVLATFVPAAPTLLDERTLAEARARVRVAEAALAQARAQREQARAESEFAQSESRRTKSLAEQGVMSAQQLESAETDARARPGARRRELSGGDGHPRPRDSQGRARRTTDRQSAERGCERPRAVPPLTD